MDHRGNEIINCLIKKESVSLDDLSSRLHTTLRNTQHLIYELNEDLQAQGLPILFINDDLVYFSKRYDHLVDDLQKFLLQSNFYTYRLTKNERRTIIAMILLNSTEYLTALELSEHLQASRGTILSDINEVKSMLENNGIELVSRVSRGYIVQSTEKQIRNQILKLLNMNFNQNLSAIQYNTFQHFLLREVIAYETIYPIVKKIVLEEEKKEGYLLSDFSFHESIYELLILISRLQRGKIVKDDLSDTILQSSKFQLSNNILKRVCMAFNLPVPTAEVKNFIQFLRAQSYLKSSTNHINEIAIPVMIGETMFNIVNHFHLNFYLDDHLYDLLVDHMKSAIHRTRNGNELINPLVNQMIDKYPEIFGFVKKEVQLLEDYIGIRFTDDEIAFLVMYFAAMIERQKADKEIPEKVNVMIVSSMGRGAMQLLQGNLAQLSKLIDIKITQSAHQARPEDILENDIKLVISTVGVDNLGVPVILVESPVLTDEDINTIRLEVMRILEEMHYYGQEKTVNVKRRKNNKLVSYLSEAGILLNYETKKWQQAIRKAGELLYVQGFVEERYINAMVENIYINGGIKDNYAFISKDTIMPHAVPEAGAKRDGMSIVRLKNPIILDQKKIKYVTAISVLGAESVNEFVFMLINIFQDEEVLRKMDSINDEQEMYKFVVGLEAER